MILDDDGNKSFGLVTKEYWDERGALNDSDFPNENLLPHGFSRDSESVYSYNGTVEDGREALLAIGFEEIPTPEGW